MNGTKVAAGVAAVTLGFWALGAQVRADGFRNPPEGAAALGRAGQSMTRGDDPSAVIHNPANAVDRTAPEAMVAVLAAYRSTDYRSDGGLSESSRSPWGVLPAVCGTFPVADGRYVVGVAVHSPFGQSSSWAADGLFRYMTPYEARMRTVNVNPTLSTVWGPVAVGIGLDVLWSDLEFAEGLPWGRPPEGLRGPGSDLRFSGRGTGIGGHAGVTWRVGEDHRFAMTYRSPIRVVHSGDFKMIPMLPPQALAAMPIDASVLAPESDFEMKVNFPAVAALAYGFRATDSLRIEAGAEWVEHSRNRAFDLDVGRNQPLLLLALNGRASVAQDWRDTWSYGIGMDWQASDDWTVRAGLRQLPSPVPESTLTPTLAEGDKTIVALGAGYRCGPNRIDAAYAATFEEDRSVKNAPAAAARGRYESSSHLMAVSYTREF